MKTKRRSRIKQQIAYDKVKDDIVIKTKRRNAAGNLISQNIQRIPMKTIHRVITEANYDL